MSPSSLCVLPGNTGRLTFTLRFVLDITDDARWELEKADARKKREERRKVFEAFGSRDKNVRRGKIAIATSQDHLDICGHIPCYVGSFLPAYIRRDCSKVHTQGTVRPRIILEVASMSRPS